MRALFKVSSLTRTQFSRTFYNVPTKNLVFFKPQVPLLSLRYYAKNKVETPISPTADPIPDTDIEESYFDSIDNQRNFLKSIEKRLNIYSLSNWYDVSYHDIIKAGGKPLLNKYNHSLFQLFSAIYDENEWLPWDFKQDQSMYWESPENQKYFTDWFANEKNLKKMSDWYNITEDSFKKLGGTPLLAKYNNSLLDTLQAMYPKFEFLPWRFKDCPPTFFNDIDNKRRFFDWAEKELHINDKKDWYNVSLESVLKLGGGKALGKKTTLCKLLQQVYPDYDWKQFKFVNMQEEWKEIMNDQRSRWAYLKYLRTELEIAKYDQWQNVTNEKLEQKPNLNLPPAWRANNILLFASTFKNYT